MRVQASPPTRAIARKLSREHSAFAPTTKLSGDQAKDANLIGQFGVGFYSGFIVAKILTVVTRRAGEAEAVRWESSGEGDFTIEASERAGRGTDVILTLRDGEDDFLSSWRLKSILTKYSDHITIPVLMKKEEWDKDKNEMVVKEAMRLMQTFIIVSIVFLTGTVVILTRDYLSQRKAGVEPRFHIDKHPDIAPGVNHEIWK